MTTTELVPRADASQNPFRRSADGFRHEALFYEGLDDFRARTVPFLAAGVEAREPILVVVSREKIRLLRADLGRDAKHVLFADMADVGANPARIIPAWQQFVGERVSSARGGRGIGEPIWASRSPAELVECQRHEALLNLAFAGVPSFWLVCPYDTQALGTPIIAEAKRSHPYLRTADKCRSSKRYPGLGALAEPLDLVLPEPGPECAELAFRKDSLAEVRRFAADRALLAGLSSSRSADLVLAVNELATNSLRYGGGHGTVRAWQAGPTLLCEVRDHGRIEDPLAGRQRPAPTQEGGHGLWLVHQLCDLVQTRVFPTGTVVRLHFRIS